jgi:methylmalonyl-CoA mutase
MGAVTRPDLTLRDPLDTELEFERPSEAEWRSAVERALGPGGLDRLDRRVAENVTARALYMGSERLPSAGFPGVRPWTRGSKPGGNSHTGWEVCQRVRHPNPQHLAMLAGVEVGGGASGVWIDLRRSESARLVARDLDALVDAADPEGISVRLGADGHAVSFAAAWVDACSRRGLDLSRLRGSFGVDPLGRLAAAGELADDPEAELRLAAEVVRWTLDAAPGVRTIAVRTLPYQGAGADAAEELAFAAAGGLEYLRRLVDDGFAVEAACGQIGFVTAVGRDLFVEIAKLRALRRMWSRVAEVFGATDRCPPPHVHAVTSPRSLSRRDPWTNMLRSTVAAFAATAGGADAITVLPFDSAIGHPDDHGRRIARNTNIILREESNLHRIVDPAGGSYLVEELTDQLARSAWSILQDIEGRGGMLSALASGFVARRMAEAAARLRAEVATRHWPITGVSTFPNLAEEVSARPEPAPPTSAEAPERGDAAPLEPLGHHESGRLFDAVVAAAGAGASLAELTTALAGSPEPTRIEALPNLREAEPFEALRDASDRHAARTGHRPSAFLAGVGPLSENRARADFVRNLLAAGGVEMIGNDAFEGAATAAREFGDAASSTAVICSTDERYPDLVPRLARALKAAGAVIVLVAGRPTADQSGWPAAGVDGYLHTGCDARAVLEDIHRIEGVAGD